MPKESKIAVIGLGYVGLPLALGIAKHYKTLGFDVNESRISELKQHYDRTEEASIEQLKNTSLSYTSNTDNIADCDIYIITVPTPITEDKKPDLTALSKASEAIGSLLSKGDIVVYESTVYPGVTEDYCAPILEKVSGLVSGEDFFLGYSPERINPGDKVHTVDKITKVVSAQNERVAALLAEIYGSVNNNNIFIAKNIKVAEAAKVIENTQRDINIAFINEITTIFSKVGISVYDVLEAANTKWNFLDFKPGLVGGHCIGVDPYYLASLAQTLDEEPRIILSGRRINENMSEFIAKEIHKHLGGANKKLLMLGVTFKENVPDLRNRKIFDLIEALRLFGHDTTIVDPHADKKEAKELYGVDIISDINVLSGGFDAVIGGVAHQEFLDIEAELSNLINDGGIVADIKRIWNSQKVSPKLAYWSL
jgi:UDP-N-acetyl-D-galactosamine dehydrogenase